MSSISIRKYFPFSRVKMVDQTFSIDSSCSLISVTPDERFTPVCTRCGEPCTTVHSVHSRSIRDLDLASTRVNLLCKYRKIHCSQCHAIVVEDLGFFDIYQRLTNRLALYIYELCKVMSVRDVARHLGLDWKTVKAIDKTFLERDHGTPDLNHCGILAVDEIALKKGHYYMIVVLDYESGRVLWMGRGRSSDTLKSFFSMLTPDQKESLKAVAMDMWDPFIKAVTESVPHVKIVFDLFHVVSAFQKVIDKIRLKEYHEAAEQDKAVYKGSKYLLLRNTPRNESEHDHLNRLLDLNKTLSKMMILRDMIKNIWTLRSSDAVKSELNQWTELANTIEHQEIKTFIKRLKRYSFGIENHAEYPIHTSKLEGVNNKIKVIKRKAYGFHDDNYFKLKVIQGFDNKSIN